MNKALFIVGPTGIGKTETALRLAKRFGGELVSADSRQVFRGLDIITGKDIPADAGFEKRTIEKSIGKRTYALRPYTLGGIPLWLTDVAEPDEEFSVLHFKILSETVVGDIHRRSKLPIVVGGTGLYVESLIKQHDTFHIPPDRELRDKLSGFSLQNVQELMCSMDSGYFHSLNRSEQNNRRRLIRKYEILSSGKKKESSGKRYDVCVIGLTVQESTLKRRIEDRVRARIQSGALEEALGLKKLGIGPDMQSVSALGYRKILPLLAENSDLSDIHRVIDSWISSEMRYAKRQMRWFRKMKNIRWFDLEERSFQDNVEAWVLAWYTTEK